MYIPEMFLCKFDQNPAIDLENIAQENYHFQVLRGVGLENYGHQNLINTKFLQTMFLCNSSQNQQIRSEELAFYIVISKFFMGW